MWRFRPFVHRYINPITRPVAKRLPTFAILTHRGRKSGRIYRTPINVFQRGNDYYFFFLTYGSDVQWVKNVLATGSCSIETRGRVVELVEPELVTDPELRPARVTSASWRDGSPVPRSTCGCVIAPELVAPPLVIRCRTDDDAPVQLHVIPPERAAVRLIVVCQCAVARRVVAP